MRLNNDGQIGSVGCNTPQRIPEWKTSMRGLLALLSVICLGTGATTGPCGNPTGLYEASIKRANGDVYVALTLNLFCDKGAYAAQLFTSMGDYTVKDAATKDGVVAIAFDSGASLGTLTLTDGGKTLTGPFTFGPDKGSIVFTRTGNALAADAMKPRTDLTPAQWHEDLAFYARELPKYHANAFFRIGRAQFEAEARTLDQRVGAANGDEMFVGLQAITKSIGDGHTGIVAPGYDRRVMPIQIAKFGSDLRIVAASVEYKRLLGTRIVKIGGKPVGDVWSRVMTLTPAGELEQLRREDALVYLARGYALHGLGIIPDRNRAAYTMGDDAGNTFTTDVMALTPDQDARFVSAYSESALRLQNKGAAFWCKALEQATVYCGWRGYQDLDTLAKQMFALADQMKAAKLILDMRDNGGGDNTVGDADIVKPLVARKDINRKGHLYVLIGAQTFSAAMNNAAQLQDETNAILVGETIGEKPNSYQEPRQFRLPNSHLIVRASTLYYEFRKNGPNEVAPDKTIIPTWDDAKAGRDPVLDWVLAQKVN
jgi:hypothetical protein